jgi:hypothetical protein
MMEATTLLKQPLITVEVLPELTCGGGTKHWRGCRVPSLAGHLLASTSLLLQLRWLRQGHSLLRS